MLQCAPPFSTAPTLSRRRRFEPPSTVTDGGRIEKNDPSSHRSSAITRPVIYFVRSRI
jgi:hypothetical protein